MAPTLLTIPDELLTIICENLYYADVIKLARVCNQLRAFTNIPDVDGICDIVDGKISWHLSSLLDKRFSYELEPVYTKIKTRYLYKGEEVSIYKAVYAFDYRKEKYMAECVNTAKKYLMKSHRYWEGVREQEARALRRKQKEYVRLAKSYEPYDWPYEVPLKELVRDMREV